MGKRICKKCGQKFEPNIWNQIYCGSKTKKLGCSWINVSTDRSKKRWKTDGKYREYQREYQKKWKKEQRKKNTNYARRQRKLKREYYVSSIGKRIQKKWRKNNIKKILEWNRKRMLQKMGVEGSHTQEEWENLKKQYNYCCAKCGVSERELEKKWEGTFFIQLTKDHIVPISKGGTDNIDNIQPLCISCNTKKYDELWEK